MHLFMEAGHARKKVYGKSVVFADVLKRDKPGAVCGSEEGGRSREEEAGVKAEVE